MGEEVEVLMKSGQTKEELGGVLRWYHKYKGHNTPLSREGLNQIFMDREELYWCWPPDGRKLSVLVQLGEVDDGNS